MMFFASLLGQRLQIFARNMRFGFGVTDPNYSATVNNRELVASQLPPTPKEDIQWVPLQHHPVFSAVHGGVLHTSATKMAANLLAWDGASRLYFWDSEKGCVHRISIRLGEPESNTILAASPAKVLQAESQLKFDVYKISINRNGSALLLSGLEGLCVMHLYGRSTSKENTMICRTVSVGSEIYFNKNNIIRTLQISWHPYSESHLGILSSDSVFRIFNLSSDLDQPEQEYYLQPIEPGASHKVASMCPVSFSFGGDHLWDRFTVFVLFSDGSVYILCPVVPFGSVYKWESLLEIYSDAQTCGLNSHHPEAVSNSSLAISWLEATFPELAKQAEESGHPLALKARPYVLLDSAITLQGPLPKFCPSEGPDDEAAPCVGRAVSFLCDMIRKDTILITAWSGGQLQIDALTDEIQPVWNFSSRPRLSVDVHNHVIGVAMICESVSNDMSKSKLNHPSDYTAWMAQPPLLLRLAIVDLALPNKSETVITMFVDPLIPERIYCLHNGGIDSIVLHFLPFTNQSIGRDDKMRSPSVNPVLCAPQGEVSSSSGLCGFLALSDSFGDSWIVGLSSCHECIVLTMETWNTLVTLYKESESAGLEELKSREGETIISKDLLGGPKAVLLPQSSANLRSVASDSIEGRSALHQYFKFFHENYLEYAHKVHFELQRHAPRLKEIVDDLHSRLRNVEQKLSQVEENQEKIEDRIDHACQFQLNLEMRLRDLRNKPGALKKPLSKAEKDFKSELDRFTGMELDALRSSLEALEARLKRHVRSPQQQLTKKPKNVVSDDEIFKLRSSLGKLALVNSENTKKIEVIESVLRTRDVSDR